MSLSKSLITTYIDLLDVAIQEGTVEAYSIVECMPQSLRDELGNALYAYSANQDAVTSHQGLDELTQLDQDMGGYDE